MYKSIIISYLLPKSSLMIYRLLVSIVTGETRRLVIYCFVQTRLFIYLKLLSLFLLKNQFSLKNKNKTKICFSLGRRGSQDGAISPSRYHSPLTVQSSFGGTRRSSQDSLILEGDLFMQHYRSFFGRV